MDCHTTVDDGNYIKLFYGLIIISLLYPGNVQAQTNEQKTDIQIQQPADDVIYRPSEDVVEAAKKIYEAAQAKQKIASANYGGSCVKFAKNYLKIYGTWGNGGHLLSINSGPVKDAVVIFKGTHVAIVTSDGIKPNGMIDIVESNYDYHGHIRTREISPVNPTVKGFHLFQED